MTEEMTFSCLEFKIDYPLSESFKLSAFGGFTSRDSSSGLDGIDYDMRVMTRGPAWVCLLVSNLIRDFIFWLKPPLSSQRRFFYMQMKRVY